MSRANDGSAAEIEGERGAIVVCALGDGSPRASVASHTPETVPVVVCRDDGELADAIDAVAPADVAIVGRGCDVAAGWLARLAAGARSSPGIATVSPLAEPLADLDDAAAWLERHASAVFPRLATPSPACVLVRRSAIELVGGTIVGEGPILDPEFARRCLAAGLWHCLAADALVSVPESSAPFPRAHEVVSEPVARARGVVGRLRRRLSVLVDARILAGPLDGTRVHVLEILGALGRADRADVSALVGPDLSPDTAAVLAGLGGVRTVVAAAGQAPGIRADVVHRPHQVSNPADLAVLAACAERVIVTQQDLIGYHSRAYFPSDAEWQGYRDITALSLAVADHVLFPSDDARDDALAAALVTEPRSATIHHGVDHAIAHGAVVPSAPSAAAHVADDAETIVCLGTDLNHKNRPFALRVAEALRVDHGWRGTLVLAGPRVRFGSSREVERRLLDELPDLAASVLALSVLTEPERRWMLERAALVVYPSIQEGFGFLPFEAAAAGRPCLWAPGTAMSELLPDWTAGIVPWDAALTADRAAKLLRDETARGAWVREVTEASRDLRWDVTADALLDVYAAVAAAAPNPAAVRERRGGVMREGLSEDAMRLVGPGGLLPADVERPLLALAARPRAARSVYGALRLGYRLARRR